MVVNRVKKLIHQHRCFEIEEMKWVYRCNAEAMVFCFVFVCFFLFFFVNCWSVPRRGKWMW